MRTRFLLFLAAALVLLSGCDKTKTKSRSGDFLLPVMETTDIHGYIVSREDDFFHYRMAYIADKAKDIRGRGAEYAKDRLLLLDGGDLYQGASISNLLGGQPVSAAVDRMEYDAVALGNHEFDWGIESTVDPDATMPDYEWAGSRQVNDIPVLCANLYLDGSRAPFTKDYVIVEKTARSSSGETVPVRIGIIGFAVDYASSIMSSKFTDRGFSIREDYSIADDLARELESSGQCDATVLLVHGAADYVAAQLAWNSAIDLVLGGHSHARKSGRRGSGPVFLQGGRYCEHYSSADLKFLRDRKTGEVSFSSVVNVKNYAVSASFDQHRAEGQNAEDLDEDVLAICDAAIAATALEGDDVIGHIEVDATQHPIAGSGERATAMSNWMCDILRRVGDADVSFVNSGGVRTTFPLGGASGRDITVANVYEMFPFNNTTYVYEITYAELLQLLRYSLTGSGGSLFTFMTGIDCEYRGNAVLALAKDGATLYRDGRWTGDWASRKLLLSVSEYLATTQRTDSSTGLSNPLPGWNTTQRLLSSDRVDNESAVVVLKAEAAASRGLLSIDTTPHFILR